MKRISHVDERARIGILVARKSDLLSVIARGGYEEHGRGAVFYCEAWEQALPEAAPFYLPASAPEFTEVGAEIETAVLRYQPATECVVVVVTDTDEVYVVKLKLELASDGKNPARSEWMH